MGGPIESTPPPERSRSFYHRRMILTASQAAANGSSNNTELIAFIVAGIALLGTIFSSYTSARVAKSINKSGLQAQRISELENRISDRKYEVYSPMIELLAKVVLQTENLTSAEVGGQMIKFSTWLAIYGSPEAVIAFRNFRQASFSQASPNGAPGLIYYRLYAEFVLAVRRDIGRSDAQIKLTDILGMVATDLYTDQNFYEAVSLPFDEVCSRHGWTAIWSEEAINARTKKAPIGGDSTEGLPSSQTSKESSPTSQP
jgi:hypothetical protein